MNLATENAIDSPLVEKKRTPRGATITKIDAGYIDAALLGMFQIEIRQTRDAIIYLLSNPHPDYDCISERLGIDYSFLDRSDFNGFVEHCRRRLEQETIVRHLGKMRNNPEPTSGLHEIFELKNLPYDRMLSGEWIHPDLADLQFELYRAIETGQTDWKIKPPDCAGKELPAWCITFFNRIQKQIFDDILHIEEYLKQEADLTEYWYMTSY